MIELEALQEVDSGVRALGGRILAISPQLEKYARSVHRKLNLTFDILTDLHFIMMNPNTVCLCLPAT
jgi:peroxiredoxin